MSTQGIVNPARLHFGGSVNPKTGALGPKPRQGRQFRSLKRFETIARLENAGFTPSAMAPMLCVSIPRIKKILQSPEYHKIRIRITHGIIIDHDASLAQIREQRKEMLTQQLPSALQTLANELLRPANTLQERKFKAEMALELMDREGTFAKVSRTEVKPVEFFDFEHADSQSRSLLSAIRAVAPPSDSATHTVAAIDANTEFSSSHTLSAVDQQAALKSLEDVQETGEFSEELLEITPPLNNKVN